MADEVKVESTGEAEVSLSDLVEQLARERGLDLRGYKPGTLGRRLRKRLAEVNAHNYREYLDFVQREPGEINQLLNTLLINLTEFFRDPSAWEVLRLEVLPKLLQGMRPGSSFRAWCAGCSSGEEAYSLAILLAEHFGAAAAEYDLKVYATDADEDALNIARRGEYPVERLRRVRPEWRQKYFYGSGSLRRVHRDLRRMVIFGRGNLMSDAPISHCHLVTCRNVLIYFDSTAQKRVFPRLYYALEPEGVLFLGKAESKLMESRRFRPLNSRWRIFQKVASPTGDRGSGASMDEHKFPPGVPAAQQEVSKLRMQQRYILETVKSGIIVLDADDIVSGHNDTALSIWGLSGARLVGRQLQNSDLMARCPELGPRLEGTRAGGGQALNFECTINADGEEKVLAITMRPMMNEVGERTGTLLNCEDITHHERLQIAVEQLEATSEELHSSNEELETTNEELQSTNEELETSNEELQSTNEELETTNEELQSLNEELENMNEELEHRTRDLNELTARHAGTLQSMPWPVLLVDGRDKIQVWNKAAQKLFGVGTTSVVGVALDQLPVENPLRHELLKRCRAVMKNGKPALLAGRRIKGSLLQEFDVHFAPIARGNSVEGVLVMFGAPQAQAGPGVKARAPEGRQAKAAAAKPGRKKQGAKGKSKSKRR